MEIKAKVLDLLSSKCDISKINDDTELTKIGLDSLDLVEMMLNLETELNVEFDSNEIADVKTLSDVISLIEKKLQ